MIFELRTYLVKPRSVSKVEERFAEALPGRVKLSPLGGLWHTEVGTLNQVIHLWPYESLAERERIRGEAGKVEGWPPNIREFMLEQDTKIFNAAPFCPAFEPRQLGGLYEIRMYSFMPGAIPQLIERWKERIGERTKLSPLVAAGFTEIGPLNKWIHIWAYRDMAERERVRVEAVKRGIWPSRPLEEGQMVKQENMLVIPASFSPLR